MWKQAHRRAVPSALPPPPSPDSRRRRPVNRGAGAVPAGLWPPRQRTCRRLARPPGLGRHAPAGARRAAPVAPDSERRGGQRNAYALMHQSANCGSWSSIPVYPALKDATHMQAARARPGLSAHLHALLHSMLQQALLRRGRGQASSCSVRWLGCLVGAALCRQQHRGRHRRARVQPSHACAGLALPSCSAAAAWATRASHCARQPLLTCTQHGIVGPARQWGRGSEYPMQDGNGDSAALPQLFELPPQADLPAVCQQRCQPPATQAAT